MSILQGINLAGYTQLKLKNKMETENNLKERVIALLMDQIKDKARTAYQLNLATSINLSTCAQIINGNWNPTWNSLLAFEAKYSKK